MCLCVCMCVCWMLCEMVNYARSIKNFVLCTNIRALIGGKLRVHIRLKAKTEKPDSIDLLVLFLAIFVSVMDRLWNKLPDNGDRPMETSRCFFSTSEFGKCPKNNLLFARQCLYANKMLFYLHKCAIKCSRNVHRRPQNECDSKVLVRI